MGGGYREVYVLYNNINIFIDIYVGEESHKFKGKEEKREGTVDIGISMNGF